MKIAVVQMHYPKGHRRLDQEYVRILSNNHKLVIVDDGKYFTEEFCTEIGAERFSVHPLKVRHWELMRRIMHYINLTVVLLTLKFHKKDFDVLLFLNIHNALYFFDKCLPKKKVVIFHHQDVDDMISYPKYYNQFLIVKDHFIHVCLADFISAGLINETGVSRERVYTVYQPLVFEESDLDHKNKENLLIGIGNSTDESIVDKLIEIDMNSGDNNSNNQLIIRSMKNRYKGTHLRVISGYLSRESYESLYNRAKVCVVIYPQRYRLRYSGIIDDSLSKGLVVFSNDTPCARYFAAKYPSNVFIFNTINEFWELSLKRLPEPNKSEYFKFVEVHSASNVANQLSCVIDSI